VNHAVITGAGIVTPFAQSAAALHRILCEGAPSRPIPTFSTDRFPCHLGTAIDNGVLDAELSGRPLAGIDRAGRLTLLAAQRAAAASQVPSDTDGRIGVVLGTMFSGASTIAAFDRRAQSAGPGCASPLDFANTVLNAAAGQTAIKLALRGVNATIAGGYASGLQAIAYGSDLIAAGRAEMLLAGGIEELFQESFAGHCQAGVVCGTNGRPGHVPVPFDLNRTGLSLGEAAGFVVLEAGRSAVARGATVRAEVLGAASATDPDALMRGFCDRQTIADVIVRALARARVDAADIDAVSASANGSYPSDDEEAAALALVFGGAARPPAVTAIKSVTGETLGASGPLQIVAMLEAMHADELSGIYGLRDAGDCPLAAMLSSTPRRMRIHTAMILSVSPDGGCCALVLRIAGAHA
jgi:3-oxoacyl-[acyl-carrier-protein] synthase II